MHACPRRKSNKHFEAESLPFSPYQVRNSGLADAERFGGIGLGKFIGLDELTELSHEIRAHLKDCSLLGRKTEINKHVAGRCYNLFFHRSHPNLRVTFTGYVDILLARFSRFLLERVQHINRFLELATKITRHSPSM
jgi:hypothetical protein